MTKVCHIITRLDLGGAQKNTLYTCAHLNREVFLVTGPGGVLDEQAKALSETHGFKLIFLPSLRREVRPIQDLLALLELANLLRAEAPDIVHTHSSKAGILGRLAAALAGVPIIIHTYHGFGFNEQQTLPVRSLYVFLEKLAALVSTVLVFVSRSNWETARARGIGQEKNYRLIRSGVKLSGYPAALPDKAKKKAELGLGMHKPLVVSIGNLKPQKNPLDFVAAAKTISDSLPECEFLFIGEGPLRTQVEARVIAAGLSHRFRLPGWREDTAQWLAAAEVFVLTSLWEGLPRALVEAMRSKLPPVCYAVDGVVDLVKDGENGFLVAPGDTAALAERVVRLLKDEALRKRFSAAAACAIGEEFDIDGMVQSQERLYDELS